RDVTFGSSVCSARRAARFTPCPYTTLFRSGWSRSAGLSGGLRTRGRGRGRRLLRPGRRRAGRGVGRSWRRRGGGGSGGAGDARRDRKSTRLNSSHAQNAYAVFCLKNKPRSV